MDTQVVLLGVIWYIVFVFSISWHEAAHALIARKLGDATASGGGLATPNPLPHIRRSPIGMIIFPIASYLLNGWMMGWASVPYDPYWQINHPRKSAWMSLAGPAANLSLVIAAAIFIRVGIAAEWFYAPESINFTQVAATHNDGWLHGAAIVVSIVFSLNFLLCIFNLLPLPPLDGSGLVPLFVSEDSARRYFDILANPGASLFGLIVAWRLFGYIYPHLHLLAINGLYAFHSSYHH